MAVLSFRWKRWFSSTSKRTFIVFPVALFVVEYLIHEGLPNPAIWGLPFLPWGYLQYRWSGNYRTRNGGGGPGVEIPPDRIVDSGIYAWTRNPMYLGHIIFMTGLAISLRSLPGLALLIYHLFWFHSRVLHDEQRLQQLFGQPYLEYKTRVKRWIPGLF